MNVTCLDRLISVGWKQPSPHGSVVSLGVGQATRIIQVTSLVKSVELTGFMVGWYPTMPEGWITS